MSKILVLFSILCIASGIIPLVYGIFNSGCGFLLLAGALLLFVTLRWSVLPHIWRVVLTSGMSLGFSVCLIISGFMLHQAYKSPPLGNDLPVIVLGARVYEDGPTLMLARRLDAAAAYLAENPNVICIVSGGQGPDEPFTEASAMAKYLIEKHNIDPGRILQEDKSSTTAENLLFSRELLGDEQSVVIVTDLFHQFRASIYAKRAGLDAYSIVSYAPPGMLPAYWVRDILGVLYAWTFT